MNLDRLRTTAGMDVTGKRVLVRCDLNVPAKDGAVTDATRLERIVPGLRDLAKRGARVIVICGSPWLFGQARPPVFS